jgi:hypothetical protein
MIRKARRLRLSPTLAHTDDEMLYRSPEHPEAENPDGWGVAAATPALSSIGKLKTIGCGC